MKEYEQIKHTDQILKNAIWEVYGKKCFYCGIMLNMNNLEIDHIIPQKCKGIKYSDGKVELEKYISEIIQNGMRIDCIANYLPSCGCCNKRKESTYFTIGNLRYFHEYAYKKAKKVLEIIEKNKLTSLDKSQYEENDKLIVKKQENKSLLAQKAKIEAGEFSYYLWGLGKVRIDAYLPVNFKDSLSCIISIGELIISLSEQKIIQIFFSEVEEMKNEKSYIREIDSGKYLLVVDNCRYNTEYEAMIQLNSIMKDLYNEFYLRKAELINTVGGRYFTELEKGKFKLISVSKETWNKMNQFAKKYDYFSGETEWHIFKQNNYNEMKITVYKNYRDEMKADVFVELEALENRNGEIDIIWNTGYTAFESKRLENYDNKIKWKVDFTHDWIIDIFLPQIYKNEKFKYLTYYNCEE